MSNAMLNRICNDENDPMLREDREDVDIRSKYVIPRLAKRIKELKEVLASYESRDEGEKEEQML
ncbi:hypothetical protein H5410_007474 [Solanum commersonii]|uniref:Uncharacterized protein n=1 Tax=Solanum commersonii TaxID=4109 RepID=A0A9J6ACK0_SOLCO|nr:hypothetical protein H5410_007474 [Solanum commersonii]